MASLLAPKPPTTPLPPIPETPEPVAMPDPGDVLLRQKKRKAANKRRGGRMATVLTGGSDTIG